MSYEEILEKVIDMFSTVTEEKVTEESDLMEDLEITSMDVLLIVTSLEGMFGVKITEQDMLDISTIGDVAAMIGRLGK